MSFVAKYSNTCSFCGEELKGQKTSYANDRTLVHSTRCLVLYNSGVNGARVTEIMETI